VNCDGVIREISNYIDGELEPVMREDLEQHLKDCKHCSLTIDQTRLTMQLFCDDEVVELPADVKARLHEGLKKKLRVDS
jgi:anti-sigma factor RsiW